MLLDLKSDVKVTQLVTPVGRAAGTVTGDALSLTGYGSVAFVFGFGGLTGGTVAVKLQESDDGSTGWTDIAADRLNGSLVAGSANSVQVVGLTEIGALAKAYVRPHLTITGGTALEAAVYAIQGNPKVAPVGSSGSIYLS